MIKGGNFIIEVAAFKGRDNEEQFFIDESRCKRWLHQ